MEHPHPVPHPKRPPAGVFVALTIVIFALLLSAAYSIGFVPYYVDGTPSKRVAPTVIADDGVQVLTSLSQLTPDTLLLDSTGRLVASLTEASESAATAVLPARISIPAIDLDLAIQNPSTTDVHALDALLVNGPARYADSAKLGEKGNVIIFAHSSRVPVVRNPMYKAFNRVPELAAGDTITVTGVDGIQYLYRVKSVTKADVSDDVALSLAKNATTLTLVTCDTLTGKSARFILDASFIGTVDPSTL